MVETENNVGVGDTPENGGTLPAVFESEEPPAAPISSYSKCLRMTVLIAPAIFNIFDTASDWQLAHEYYKKSTANSTNETSPNPILEPQENYVINWSTHSSNTTGASLGPKDYWIFFIYTITFIIVPAVLVTFTNCVFYLNDRKRKDYEAPSKEKICCIVIHTVLLQCPLLRDFEVIYYGTKLLRKPNDPRYSMKLKKALSDSAFLCLFETFTEDAPQALLQVYIFYKLSGSTDANLVIIFWQFVSILTGLGSLAWMVTSYNDTSRTVTSKTDMSIFGMVTQLLWHFCIISSTVLAWAIFAHSTFSILVAVTGTSYWLAALIYVRYERRRRDHDSQEDKENNEAEEFYSRTIISNHDGFYMAIYDFFVDCSLALAYVFDVIKIRDMPMTRVYLVFYGITFLKYVFIYCLEPELTKADAPFVLFLAGLFFMLIYYKCSHSKTSCFVTT